MKEKAVIGMSGGVDSSVAACLLKKDYDVIGVTLLLHGNDDSDARAVARSLGIEHMSVDMSKVFEKYVINNFLDEYTNARTPNPCVWCNYYLKFGAMLDIADSVGAKYIATGHYSRLVEYDGELFPARALFSEKDQTYALYRLTQEKLRRLLFPLGNLAKSDVRKIAEDIGLSVANKKDSQEICFIPDGDYASYIEKRRGKSPEGNMIGPDGEILGRHRGLIHYTVGQRRGIGVSYSERIFVSRLDAEKNEVILGREGAQSRMRVSAGNVTFISAKPFPKEISCTAKIRYNGLPSPCRVFFDGNTLTAEFETPARGVSPGQSLVLYDGERLLGGGIID